MTGATAALFPGMAAAEFGDLGRFLVLDRYVRRWLRAADDALGAPLLPAFRAESAESAESADYGPFSQVAFLVSSLALAERAESEYGMRPDVCVGPSLGQRAAAVYSGAVGFAEAVRLTVGWARCEEEYFAAEPDDFVTQCFVRVPPDALLEVLADLDKRGEWAEVSAELGNGTVMVSMCEAVLGDVVSAVRRSGGYVMQAMRPAVHARRFTALREKAAAVLDGYPVADPEVPIVADQDGRVVRTADGVRTLLLDGFDRPVDWPAAVTGLAGLGVGTVYVTGPDHLFHRLDATRSLGEIVAVTPETVSRQAGWRPDRRKAEV
ncbi:acyltransferase domain-containing protein [Amycolatopsis jejuensis]|uniref:acyltransferase domain-containing protein n=1 Tax=Amycolatopsis jejuensis TaxID=330084 RepID=UPI0005263046|nr:acyltransferase domain-containing protein [Amycolatopsis jejuensis]